jgi:hypothetical protein
MIDEHCTKTGDANRKLMQSPVTTWKKNPFAKCFPDTHGTYVTTTAHILALQGPNYTTAQKFPVSNRHTRKYTSNANMAFHKTGSAKWNPHKVWQRTEPLHGVLTLIEKLLLLPKFQQIRCAQKRPQIFMLPVR